MQKSWHQRWANGNHAEAIAGRFNFLITNTYLDEKFLLMVHKRLFHLGLAEGVGGAD